MKKCFLTIIGFLIILALIGCTYKEKLDPVNNCEDQNNGKNQNNNKNDDVINNGNAEQNDKKTILVIKDNLITEEYKNNIDKKLVVKINYPSIENSTDCNSYEEINKSLNDYCYNFKDNINAFIDEFKTDSNEYAMDLVYDVSYDIQLQNSRYVSISYEMYTYLGGPHPDIQQFSKTYDLSNGEELTLDKIFSIKKDDYRKLLVDYVMDQSKERFKDDESVYESLDKNMLMENIRPDSFYIKDNNLVIYYYSYDFLCYALGNQEFSIPIEKISDKMNIGFTD